MYALLRAAARVALRWYYRDIQVDGTERIPRRSPALLVVNHPNALVDALVVTWTVPRRVLITAKSTLFTNPIAGALLRWAGVVPLRRAGDEAKPGQPLDPARNLGTFRAVHDALRRDGAVLIFPEGKTHDEPSLAPLKTGAARMALHARDAGDVPDLTVVPIGLTFERKDAPRTRVFVQVGEPIVMADWRGHEGSEAEALTREIDTRLRAVTLNYASADDAARTVRLSSLVSSLFNSVPDIGVVDRGLGVETTMARRIDRLASRLETADSELRARAEALLNRLETFQRELSDHGVLMEDVEISLAQRRVLRFILREGWWLVLGGPFALWGRLNHWLPFRAARVVAMRSIESAADPAMRTVVAAAAFVLLAYLAQTAVVAAIWGPLVALLYLVSLPLAADINFSLSDRMRRAKQRARAFFLFRRDRALQRRWCDELEQLRAEAVSLETAVGEDPLTRTR